MQFMYQGRIQDFQIEGAQKIINNLILCTQRTFRPRSMKSFTTGVQDPFKGPGSSRVLDALSWYLSLILTYSDTKMDLKDIVDQNLEGARACCPPPPWIRHCV